MERNAISTSDTHLFAPGISHPDQRELSLPVARVHLGSDNFCDRVGVSPDQTRGGLGFQHFWIRFEVAGDEGSGLSLPSILHGLVNLHPTRFVVQLIALETKGAVYIVREHCAA